MKKFSIKRLIALVIALKFLDEAYEEVLKDTNLFKIKDKRR